MYTIGIDSYLAGGTLYISRVGNLQPKSVVLTPIKYGAIHFNSITEAEQFALDNNIKMYDANDPDDNTCESYSIFC